MSSRRRRRRRTGRDSARARRAAQGRRPFLRRRSTLWLAAAIVTLTVGIVLGVLAGGGDEAEPNGGVVAPTPTLAVSLPDLQPPPNGNELQRAEVVAVIDGDTIRVRMPSLRSEQAGRVERVRYYGVDTPERGDRCYAEASERNEALAGDRVLLLPDARERDRFGRLLRYVFDEQGRSIEARLIAEGLAEAWREDGVHRDELVALEEEVRAAGVGCLWQQ